MPPKTEKPPRSRASVADKSLSGDMVPATNSTGVPPTRGDEAHASGKARSEAPIRRSTRNKDKTTVASAQEHTSARATGQKASASKQPKRQMKAIRKDATDVYGAKNTSDVLIEGTKPRPTGNRDKARPGQYLLQVKDAIESSRKLGVLRDQQPKSSAQQQDLPTHQQALTQRITSVMAPPAATRPAALLYKLHNMTPSATHTDFAFMFQAQAGGFILRWEVYSTFIRPGDPDIEGSSRVLRARVGELLCNFINNYHVMNGGAPIPSNRRWRYTVSNSLLKIAEPTLSREFTVPSWDSNRWKTVIMFVDQADGTLKMFEGFTNKGCTLKLGLSPIPPEANAVSVQGNSATPVSRDNNGRLQSQLHELPQKNMLDTRLQSLPPDQALQLLRYQEEFLQSLTFSFNWAFTTEPALLSMVRGVGSRFLQEGHSEQGVQPAEVFQSWQVSTVGQPISKNTSNFGPIVATPFVRGGTATGGVPATGGDPATAAFSNLFRFGKGSLSSGKVEFRPTRQVENALGYPLPDKKFLPRVRLRSSHPAWWGQICGKVEAKIQESKSSILEAYEYLAELVDEANVFIRQGMPPPDVCSCADDTEKSVTTHPCLRCHSDIICKERRWDLFGRMVCPKCSESYGEASVTVDVEKLLLESLKRSLTRDFKRIQRPVDGPEFEHAFQQSSAKVRELLSGCKPGSWKDNYQNDSVQELLARDGISTPLVEAMNPRWISDDLDQLPHDHENIAITTVGINQAKYTHLLGHIQLIAEYLRDISEDTILTPERLELEKTLLSECFELTAIKLKHMCLDKCRGDSTIDHEELRLRREELYSGKLSEHMRDKWLDFAARRVVHNDLSKKCYFDDSEKESIRSVFNEIATACNDPRGRYEESDDGAPWPNPYQPMPKDWNWDAFYEFFAVRWDRMKWRCNRYASMDEVTVCNLAVEVYRQLFDPDCRDWLGLPIDLNVHDPLMLSIGKNKPGEKMIPGWPLQPTSLSEWDQFLGNLDVDTTFSNFLKFRYHGPGESKVEDRLRELAIRFDAGKKRFDKSAPRPKGGPDFPTSASEIDSINMEIESDLLIGDEVALEEDEGDEEDGETGQRNENAGTNPKHTRLQSILNRVEELGLDNDEIVREYRASLLELAVLEGNNETFEDHCANLTAYLDRKQEGAQNGSDPIVLMDELKKDDAWVQGLRSSDGSKLLTLSGEAQKEADNFATSGNRTQFDNLWREIRLIVDGPVELMNELRKNPAFLNALGGSNGSQLLVIGGLAEKAAHGPDRKEFETLWAQINNLLDGDNPGALDPARLKMFREAMKTSVLTLPELKRGAEAQFTIFQVNSKVLKDNKHAKEFEEDKHDGEGRNALRALAAEGLVTFDEERDMVTLVDGQGQGP